MTACVTLGGLGPYHYDLTLPVKSEGLIQNEDAHDGIGLPISQEADPGATDVSLKFRAMMHNV